MPGAGAWLTAPPAGDGREMDSSLFQVALKRRIRVPVSDADAFCPTCGGCLDRFGDHAVVCCCGGDRTIRHNAIRNVFFQDAAQAGLRPERERQGLLPERPQEDALRASGSGRRPADVWLPRGPGGRGVALDFACTSGMRSDRMQLASEDAGCVLERYVEIKRSYMGTARLCEEAGFDFTPMVIESHGSWCAAARRAIDLVSRTQAASGNEQGEVVSLRIAQRLSIALHRENARAVLRRASAPPQADSPSGWAEECAVAD